jgi:hypothetical protein
MISSCMIEETNKVRNRTTTFLIYFGGSTKMGS